MSQRMPADLDSGLHALAGHSAAFDAVVEFAAQNLVYAGVALFAVLWWHRDGLRAGAAALAGALVALAAGALVGAAWDRPRPFVAGHYAPLVAHGADASFPSDHLIVLGALTAAAWRCRPALGAALAALSALLAAARAISGIHYLTDVVAGFLMGAVLALAAWWALAPLEPVIAWIDRRLAGAHLRPSSPPPR